MTPANILDRLELCLKMRQDDSALSGTTAFRLFNGFYEGCPGLVVDRFAGAIVISNHARIPESLNLEIEQAAEFFKDIPGIDSILLKVRHADEPEARKGRILQGQLLPQEIIEHGVHYALDLRLQQDASFYLDTRNLRNWLIQNSEGKSVLNTFAYTGSLGIAALAGRATTLMQTDLNGEALALAEKSYGLNGFTQNMTILKRDFFSAVNSLKKSERLFDIVILDSPFFSSTRYGKVDLQKEHSQLINKVRPLVAHEGRLIVINNALYVSGSQVVEEFTELSESGYISLESIMEIPANITGYPKTITGRPPADPAPFNHPTKISILKVLRKDHRAANV